MNREEKFIRIFIFFKVLKMSFYIFFYVFFYHETDFLEIILLGNILLDDHINNLGKDAGGEWKFSCGKFVEHDSEGPEVRLEGMNTIFLE